MAKTYRRRRCNKRTRRGGVPGTPKKMTAKQWAHSLLSKSGKAGISKSSKNYSKHTPTPGDTSAPAHGASRIADN